MDSKDKSKENKGGTLQWSLRACITRIPQSNSTGIKFQRVNVIWIPKTPRLLQVLHLNLRQELSTAAGLGARSPDQLLNSAAGRPVLLGHNEDNSGDHLNTSYFIYAEMAQPRPVLVTGVSMRQRSTIPEHQHG